MINFYDTSAVKALVDARNERLYGERYQRKIARETLLDGVYCPHVLRRKLGAALMWIGARVAGTCSFGAPRLQQES